MALFQWSQDAPTGVFKNHKLSSKIRSASVARAVFMDHVNLEPGYGKKAGESITISRISNVTVPTSSVLVENVRIPEDSVSLSTQAITVAENGRAIPFTSFSQDLSHFDLRGSAVQKKLRQQMTLSMDIAAATQFKNGQVKMIPDGISSATYDTDGTASTTATVNLGFFHVESIRDYLFTTLNVEPVGGEDYLCFISTKGRRGLSNDPNWQEWKKYTQPEAKFNGEIGKWENIRFMEVNHSAALGPASGFSGLGEAVFFGEDAVSMAVAEDPELRAESKGDFGRAMAVAWYGIYAFGQIWSDSANAGEARSVHVTSA
jgi:N4-gp56 family major capsid protein